MPDDATPPGPGATPPAADRAADGEPTASGLPSVTARVVAFAAIVVAGAAGGFIGWSFVDLQSDSTVAAGVGGLVGAVLAAVGVGVVTVLALRAMDEWRTLQARGGPPPDPTRGRRPDPRLGRRPPRVR